MTELVEGELITYLEEQVYWQGLPKIGFPTDIKPTPSPSSPAVPGRMPLASPSRLFALLIPVCPRRGFILSLPPSQRAVVRERYLSVTIRSSETLPVCLFSARLPRAR